MARKFFKPEHTINKLCEAGILLSQYSVVGEARRKLIIYENPAALIAMVSKRLGESTRVPPMYGKTVGELIFATLLLSCQNRALRGAKPI